MLVIIDRDIWHVCKLCEAKIKDLAPKYGGCGIYYTTVFEKHLLEDHQISTFDYFKEYVSIPKCVCGECGKDSTISKKGPNFAWRSLICGRNEGVKEWAKRAKIERKGTGNPMYGVAAWNKGLTAETHESLAVVAQKMTGRQVSDDTKEKQSNSAKKRTIHGHTGHKHSEATKEASRQRTLKMIADGKFKQTQTKPHMRLCEILKGLDITFEEEKIITPWSFDVYLPDYDVYIEADGDYFHSNPKIYPNGPKTKTQRINWYRDLKKDKFCKENNLTLIRFWESDILSDDFQEKLWNIIRSLKLKRSA